MSQANLFSTGVKQPEPPAPKPRDLFDDFTDIARAKLGLDDTWSAFTSDTLDGEPRAFLVKISTSRVLTKGKNAGRRKWDREKARQCVILKSELDAFKEEQMVKRFEALRVAK